MNSHNDVPFRGSVTGKAKESSSYDDLNVEFMEQTNLGLTLAPIMHIVIGRCVRGSPSPFPLWDKPKSDQK